MLAAAPTLSPPTARSGLVPLTPISVVPPATSTSLSTPLAPPVVKVSTSSTATLSLSASTPCSIPPTHVSVLPQPHTLTPPPTDTNCFFCWVLGICTSSNIDCLLKAFLEITATGVVVERSNVELLLFREDTPAPLALNRQQGSNDLLMINLVVTDCSSPSVRCA
ncbi:hypothetical protein EDB19DRAFT_20705 [Suillus lakei]|nr:hypothetical protein EDB19DRAFT_20705 [Suillus lakei]